MKLLHSNRSQGGGNRNLWGLSGILHADLQRRLIIVGVTVYFFTPQAANQLHGSQLLKLLHVDWQDLVLTMRHAGHEVAEQPCKGRGLRNN